MKQNQQLYQSQASPELTSHYNGRLDMISWDVCWCGTDKYAIILQLVLFECGEKYVEMCMYG